MVTVYWITQFYTIYHNDNIKFIKITDFMVTGITNSKNTLNLYFNLWHVLLRISVGNFGVFLCCFSFFILIVNTVKGFWSVLLNYYVYFMIIITIKYMWNLITGISVDFDDCNFICPIGNNEHRKMCLY